MMLKRSIIIGLAIEFLLGLVQLAGAALAGPLAPGPLAQVIEGAKKEATVSVKLVSSYTPKSMYRLEKEIKDKYGPCFAV